MRVLFWSRGYFAERQIVAALSPLPIGLEIVQTLAEVLPRLATSDILLSTDIDPGPASKLAGALAASPVRYFQFLSAGRERLLAAGLPENIELFGIGDSLAPAIGEHGIALAMALYRGIPQTLMLQQTGDWAASRNTVTRRPIEGDTALIVGLGAIGRDLARRAKLLDMEVIAVTRTPEPDPNCAAVLPMDRLDEALPRAGIVFLSVALAPETRHIIGPGTLARMRPGAFIVNLARGGLIDQPALVEALQSGAIGGAGLDVTDPEPLPADDPLWRAPNTLIMPHVAVQGSTRSGDRIAAHVARNIAAIAAKNGRRS
jgi:phosphoglycerate dehydrogenase-like enzyme